jgi:type IV pilus assembly protein PilO
MTNLGGMGNRWVSRTQVLVGLPVVVGGLAALGLAAVAVWPAWQQLNISEQELEQLEEQRQRLPLLRAQLNKLTLEQQAAEQRRNAILGLIAGSGEITTFLAQLSDEAQATGVQLDGYEPVAIKAPEPSKGKQKTPPPPSDPLLAPGLQKTSVLLTARGTGPQLLALLRRLEGLSLLVVQSDLQLSHGTANEKGASADTRTSLRLQLSLYSRD